MKLTLLISTAILGFSGCETPNSVARYGMGSDSAAIKDGRNRRSAILSDSELAQHRRQRTNVSEEMAMEREKSNHVVDKLATPFDFARRIGILR